MTFKISFWSMARNWPKYSTIWWKIFL